MCEGQGRSRNHGTIEQRTVGLASRATFSKCTATHEPEGTPEKCKGKLETGKLETLLNNFHGHESNQYAGHEELQTLEEYPTPLASITCGSTTFDLKGGLGDPEVAEPTPNTCAEAMTLSLGTALGPNLEGVPVPYEIWGEEEGWPFTTVGEELYGTGLESSNTDS